MKSAPSCVVAVTSLLLGSIQGHAAPAPLKAEELIVVPGIKGRFDFIEVDAVARRLLCNHTQNSALDAFDLDSGPLLKSCPADDALFVPKNGLVYVCHDDGKDLWVMNPASGKIVASVAICEAPEVLVYDAGTDRLRGEREELRAPPHARAHGKALNGARSSEPRI